MSHHILPNSFVLENLEPYPGYHGKNLPTDRGPDSFFLVTTENNSAEKIFRLVHDIRNFTHLTFDGCPSRLCIGNDTYDAIRLRDLNSYEPLEEIQHCFMDAGIQFAKHKEVEGVALIELKKIFSLEKISDRVYKDRKSQMHYLNLQKQLTWGRFRSVTRWVKNNLDDNNFDAALVVLYGHDVYDMVRIFAPHPTLDQLELIRQKYIEGIQRTE